MLDPTHNMRFSRASCLATLALAVTTSLADDTQRRSYDGHKVFRVWTNGQPDAVKSKLDEALSFYDQWNDDVDYHIDVLITPDELHTFESLGLEYHVMHEDLGASLVAESALTNPPATWKREDGGDHDNWFDTYHPYKDHVQFFEDLHKSFPNNSKIVSSGKSYQGRDIYGLHLFGDKGPGKPAVLYHGTVHAREWIVAPVSASR